MLRVLELHKQDGGWQAVPLGLQPSKVGPAEEGAQLGGGEEVVHEGEQKVSAAWCREPEPEVGDERNERACEQVGQRVAEAEPLLK